MRHETINYQWHNDPETYQADVLIVPDHINMSSDDFDIDERIFFHFTETEWAQVNRGEKVPGIEFTITQEA
jgi:hypothetical protein